MDTRLPFGGKSALAIFNRITQTVKGMMIRWSYNLIVAYLDNFLIISNSKDKSQAFYDFLAALLLDLDFQLTGTKLVPPAQFNFLGVEINSLTMSLSLPAGKFSTFGEVITEFLGWKRASKLQLQHPAGKLNCACKPINEGHTFLRFTLGLMNTLLCPVLSCHLTTKFHRK